MTVHKLILDDIFDEALYSLIAIHCTIEDYRIAYLLNQKLNINLARKPRDLEFSLKASTYSIFEWEDCNDLIIWNLVSNISKTETIQESNYKSLFDTNEKIVKTNYLIPEYKKVNYFLKIDSELSLAQEKNILNKVLEIPQIATAFTVNASQLKSKDNLIFS